MRRREEIAKDVYEAMVKDREGDFDMLMVEILLDIRELLDVRKVPAVTHPASAPPPVLNTKGTQR